LRSRALFLDAASILRLQNSSVSGTKASVNVYGGLGRRTGGILSPVIGWLQKNWLMGLLLAVGLTTGCQSTPPTVLGEGDKQPYVAEGAQPGDTLRITFPGATSMNSAQLVQPNGMITLPLGGSMDVRGKTTSQVEKALMDLYGSQLVIKEVTVGLESAGFPVLVSGAVMKPGRVQSTRSMTVLEAIVEAGGFIEGRADMRHVRVVRLDKDGTTRTIVVDLKSALSGKSSEAVFVRPSDVINVPERFSFY
jgi:polysaccharide export outer membrane protein